MNNERITYEEFMIMFKNAPRIAYTLYDKAEDEIDRLNSNIEEQNEDIYHLLNIIERYKNDIKITSDEELAIFASQNRLEELKKEQ